MYILQSLAIAETMKDLADSWYSPERHQISLINPILESHVNAHSILR